MRAGIKLIQDGLKVEGYDPGPSDGIYGGRTDTALQTLIKAKGQGAQTVLPPKPGIAAPATLTVESSFTGAARRLQPEDYGNLGDMIGVGEDEIRAVVEVETAGGGYDTKGRPKMLFEPHVFWRELDARQRPAAEAQGLAYPKWGLRGYPADSYPRLKAAMAINTTAALNSASWGLGQIMGFNHKAAGYSSASIMVLRFMDDEREHLAAMIRFIISEGLDDDLRRHDWSGFARGYNGAGYASHGYHTKLTAAYAKWASRPDTKRV